MARRIVGATWWRGWLGSRRRRIALVVGVLLLAVRVALPAVVRSVLVSRANAAITGRLEIGDVDLWLLFGGVALKDVALHGEGAAAGVPPIATFRRFYVQVGYLPLIRRTLRVEDVALDGLALHAERERDGTVPLPGLRPTPPPAAPPAPASASKPWNVVVDRAALRDGKVNLRDHVPEPAVDRTLVLPDLALRNFTLLRQADTRPGQGSIELRFGDGRIGIRTAITTEAEGFAIDATVKLANLPLDRLNVHLPELGWSGFTGRADAALALHVGPRALPTARGTLAVRDLSIEVPGEEHPALAWRRLEVALDQVDPAARKAIVDHVAIDGAQVVAKPREPAPLPLLAARKPPPASGPPPAETPPPEPPPGGTAPAKPGGPWTWKVGRVEITDSLARVWLEPPPLEITIVKATVTGLDSRAGSRAHVDLEVRPGEGTIGVDGEIGIDPLAARVTVRLDGLPLARLVDASGASPLRLPEGVLGGEVSVVADPAPLELSGQLALAGLQAVPRDGQDFSVGWSRLEVGIKQIQLRGVLPADRGVTGQPMRIDLERLALVAPAVALTRTPDGIVLPTGGAPQSPPPATAPPTTPPPAPAAGAPSGPGVAVALQHLEVENGKVSIVDRAVKPFYRGTVSAIGIKANGLRFPENTFDDFSFTATLPGNGSLALQGRQTKGQIQIRLDEKRLPLPQFNPYVSQAAGYSIPTGAATVRSTLTWKADRYQSQSRIELDRLAVAGAEGDSLFAQHFGIPLSLALSLMRDTHGQIAFDVPVEGDRSGTRVALGTIVAQALERAILSALTSPLKLFGALAGGEGKVSAAPEPIAFRPGSSDVDPAAAERIGKLAGGLAGAPAVGVTLHGTAGRTDVRALQEAAVLSDLQAKQGLIGGVRNLANRGERNAIRDALLARARGEEGELSADQRKTLDEWAGEKTVSDDALRALAVARGESAKAALEKEHGITAGRVKLGDPEVDREHGGPALKVSLGA